MWCFSPKAVPNPSAELTDSDSVPALFLSVWNPGLIIIDQEEFFRSVLTLEEAWGHKRPGVPWSCAIQGVPFTGIAQNSSLLSFHMKDKGS